MSGVRQFSHLMLEENEEYIGDFSCVCTSNIRKRIVGQSFKGRMRIGSKSIILEPDDPTISLLKISLVQISDIKVDKANRIMVFNCKSLRLFNVKVIEGKSRTVTPCEILSCEENNCLKVSKSSLDNAEEGEPEFELRVKVSEDKGLELMDLCLELYDTQEKREFYQNEENFNKRSLLINNWLGRLYDNEVLNVEYEFLLDHRDRFLLEKPLIVNRIKPFTKLRGVLHVLSSGICFKLLPNFSNKRFKRIPLNNIWFMFKRVYSMKPHSVEIIYEKEAKRNSPGMSKANKVSWGSIFIEFQNSADMEHFVSFLQSFLISIKSKQENLTHDSSISYASCECCSRNNVPSCLQMLYIDPLYAGQSLCFRKHIQNLWINGAISTYHYIDYLNTVGGRSRGDLTQYPVFPWTVVNFEENSKLGEDIQEFEVESNYRDLSKPLGSLNKDNLEVLKKRMNDLPQSEQFLYGSHYSNPGYISYFLVRKYPEYQLKLHCGDFDVWSRMFHSVNDTWKTVLEGKTTYMELIPQFYEQNPDFLLDNRLSVRTSHGKLLSVRVPNWQISASKIGLNSSNLSIGEKAIGASERQKAEAFLRLMRFSLEGRVASKCINEWIDLIFGYKQRGKEAIKYNNLYHPITYINSTIYLQKELGTHVAEGGSAESELAVKSQVEEFGQVPLQLFREPHPKRDCKYLTDDYILSQLNSAYSNSPWFVLLKNHTNLIKAEFDFTFQSTSVKKCEVTVKDQEKSYFSDNDIRGCYQEATSLRGVWKKSEEMERENSDEDGDELDENFNADQLNFNLKKSYILELNSVRTTEGRHLFDSIGINRNDLCETVRNSLILNRSAAVPDIVQVDLDECGCFVLLCTLFKRNGHIAFYIRNNEEKGGSFKQIYSNVASDISDYYCGDEITTTNVLLCKLKGESNYNCNNSDRLGVTSTVVYLTVGTSSGDVHYLRYKLQRKVECEGKTAYLITLKDKKVIKNNMDSSVKFISSVDYGEISVVSVVSSNGTLLLCKHFNEDHSFRKTVWFPLIDVPVKNKRVSCLLNFGLSREEIGSVCMDAIETRIKAKMSTKLDSCESTVSRDGKTNDRISDLSSGAKEKNQLEKAKSRYGKITKEVDMEGFRVSCILEDRNGHKRLLWGLNGGGIFSVDLFGEVLLSLLKTKYEHGNSAIEQIQNSKSIFWTRLEHVYGKRDMIVYFGRVSREFEGTEELKAGTTVIIVWSCSESYNVKVKKVILVPNLQVDDDAHMTWDAWRKGVIFIGTLVDTDSSSNDSTETEKRERGIYFISQSMWSSNCDQNSGRMSTFLANREGDHNFNVLFSFPSCSNGEDHIDKDTPLERDKIFVKCTEKDLILHNNLRNKSLFVLNVS